MEQPSKKKVNATASRTTALAIGSLIFSAYAHCHVVLPQLKTTTRVNELKKEPLDIATKNVHLTRTASARRKSASATASVERRALTQVSDQVLLNTVERRLRRTALGLVLVPMRMSFVLTDLPQS